MSQPKALTSWLQNSKALKKADADAHPLGFYAFPGVHALHGGGWAPNPKGIGAWSPTGNKWGEMALNDMAIMLDRMVSTPRYLESHKRWEIMEPKLFNLFGFPLFFQKNAHKYIFSYNFRRLINSPWHLSMGTHWPPSQNALIYSNLFFFFYR